MSLSALTLVKGDEGVEAVQQASYFLLLRFTRDCDLDFDEIGFMYSPLSVNHTLAPLDHLRYEVISNKSPSYKI